MFALPNKFYIKKTLSILQLC